MFDLLASILSFFYQFTHSYGFAIILLTVAVRLVLFPLTAKQMRSMASMSRVQPQLKKLQAEYKDDRQKLNEEMMKFYKQEGINPAAGCFPLLLQMPVFFGLFRVIRGLSSTGPLSWLAVRVPKPDYIGKNTEMYRAIVRSGGRLMSWGFDLAQSASGVAGSKRTPYVLLVLAYGLSGWVQQSMANKRNMTQATGTAAQMQQIMKVFPIFMAVFGWSMPAGLVVYWFASNVWTIGQQEVLHRTIPRHDAEEVAVEPKVPSTIASPKQKGFGARLEQVANQAKQSQAKITEIKETQARENEARDRQSIPGAKQAKQLPSKTGDQVAKQQSQRAEQLAQGPSVAKGTKTPTRNIPSSSGKKKGR
jgi:YidC/Oxa1 family membrane protein insertase